MSQDMIRQSHRGTPGVEDVWGSYPGAGSGLAYPAAPAGGGLGYPAGPGGPNEVKPLQTIHRSLRGRYKTAILLAAVFAVGGAALGWKLNNRIYRASGLIRINPVTFDPTGAQVTTEYGRYMNSEANSIRSQEIAERAMANPKWQEVAGNRPIDPGTKAAFLSGLKSGYSGSSYDITVTYDDANPRVAVAAVDSILAAYTYFREEQMKGGDANRVTYFQTQRDAILKQIENLQAQKGDMERGSQGNIDDRSSLMTKSVMELGDQLAQARITLQRMENLKQRAIANGGTVDFQTLANREPFFARLLAARDDLAAQLGLLESQQGPQAPMVVKIRTQLAATNQRMQTLAEQFSKFFYGVLPPLGPGSAAVDVSDSSIDAKKEDIALLEKQLADLQTQLAEVDNKRVTLVEYQNKIKQQQDKLAEVDVQLAKAQAKTVALTAPFRTASNPSPEVADDRRATMASFGFVVGAGLPLLAFALYGLLDRKYRYSDETNASSITRGIPLLGILPNLPDRLSDPSQASVAAHCVHQIRTMLQLNAVNAEGPTVLSVTSATSGDGKTSLSLALGLSFAASGSRTLLIDSDLIGGGLSNRLGIREPQGISEAILARNPMEFVRDTDVADLSILPVGVQGPQNASAFSPNAVRRLMAEMRKHFDLILIDTGPVLGSIEATPVVASSDAVILTASRGQNRDLVEKAIMQLRNAGARIAGFVFNRANAKDFERSISGISLRSVSRAQAQPGQSVNGQYQDNRLGPLVHSVRGTRDDETN